MNWNRFALYNYSAGEGGRSGCLYGTMVIFVLLVALFLIGEFFRLL